MMFSQSSPTPPRGWCATAHDPVEENDLTAAYSYELQPRTLKVAEVTPLSATLVRVRFTSDDKFAGFPTVAPEDHVKLFFDHDDAGRPILPPMVDGRWSPRGLTYRDYTVRWFDAEAGTIDIDFVLHEHGTAGRWAGTARAGDQLGALGPRGSFRIKDVFPWYVFAADETALPALARWVEGLRESVPVTAYISTSGPQSHIELPTSADLTVVWLDQPTDSPSHDAPLSQVILAHQFTDLEGFVWVAGESTGIVEARRHLKRLGFARDHWDVDGYWRLGVTNLDHHQDPEGEDEEDGADHAVTTEA